MNKLFSLLLVTTCFTSMGLASIGFGEVDQEKNTVKRLHAQLLVATYFTSMVLASKKDFGETDQERNTGKISCESDLSDNEETQEHFAEGMESTEKEIPLQWDVVATLWRSKNAEDKSIARIVLRQIATTDGHPKQWDAVCVLRSSEDTEDKSVARGVLRQIAETELLPYRWAVIHTLWHSADAEDKSIARVGLRQIATTEVLLYQWFAAETLWNSRDADDKRVARGACIQIMDLQDIGETKRRQIIRLFRESNDPADQAQGLEWKLKYFPVVFSEALKAQIAEFNQEQFKASSPKSLGDVEGLESQNIPARFNALMSSIETVDEASPNYLHISVITGDENPYANNTDAITNLRKRALGFLKALTNQSLAEGEESGWQIHDENKPAFINALKHLILALERTEDPATRFNNLGIILKGLLYCPTGQVEGINSAVNSLIRGQDQLAESFEDKVAKIVHDALHIAFLNAFGEGSGVHQLSRARTVLYPHIGLTQAVEGFVERISGVHDDEIPDILQTFYRVFTPQFLSQYVLNHMQTAEDRALILHITQNLKDDSTKAKLQRAQQERPLSMMDLYCWLENHQHDPFSGFGFTWNEEAEIGNESKITLTLETVQKVLGAMGWINVAQDQAK